MKSERKLCLVDTSWLMWSSLHSGVGLTTAFTDEEGGVEVIPTGHVYGIMRSVPVLSTLFERVLMVQDSPCSWRKAIYPGYKEGRRKKGEFNPYPQLPDIIAAVTSLPNVYAVRMDGEEADDIITSFIREGYSPWVFSRDNDLLQSREPFEMFNSVTDFDIFPFNKTDCIKEKYSLDIGYLPIWWKVVRGDSSDKIPSGAPRFSGKELLALCLALKEEQSFDVFWDYFRMTSYFVKHDEGECRTALWRNYQLVSPKKLDLESLEYSKCTDVSVGVQVVHKYSLMSLYQTYAGLIR